MVKEGDLNYSLRGQVYGVLKSLKKDLARGHFSFHAVNPSSPYPRHFILQSQVNSLANQMLI